MVPPFKEAVEACFVEGLVKVVFATETLALGVNMPARSVVIESLSKFNGETHQLLTPAEYTQLTGRAGRRGLDPVGHAVVLWSPFVSFEQVASLAASRRFALTSSFRPTYNMAANLVRRYRRDEAIELLDRSFAQYQADRSVAALERRRASRVERRDRLRSRGRQEQGIRVDREIEALDRRIAGRRGSVARRFDRVLDVLDDLGHVDRERWRLTERGELLARTYHECDLLVTEALVEGLFDGLEPADLAGLVSCLVYEHRSKHPPPAPWFPSADLRDRVEELRALATSLNRLEVAARLPETRAPDPTFLPLAHAWASDLPLADVLEDEDLSGGDFVRTVRQLVDLLGQLGDHAPDPATARTARRSADALVRGVVAASSLVGRGPG